MTYFTPWAWGLCTTKFDTRVELSDSPWYELVLSCFWSYKGCTSGDLKVLVGVTCDADLALQILLVWWVNILVILFVFNVFFVCN